MSPVFSLKVYILYELLLHAKFTSNVCKKEISESVKKIFVTLVPIVQPSV